MWTGKRPYKDRAKRQPSVNKGEEPLNEISNWPFDLRLLPSREIIFCCLGRPVWQPWQTNPQSLTLPNILFTIKNVPSLSSVHLCFSPYSLSPLLIHILLGCFLRPSTEYLLLGISVPIFMAYFPQVAGKTCLQVAGKLVEVSFIVLYFMFPINISDTLDTQEIKRVYSSHNRKPYSKWKIYSFI